VSESLSVTQDADLLWSHHGDHRHPREFENVRLLICMALLMGEQMRTQVLDQAALVDGVPSAGHIHT
jgi:hypothetical protein